MNMLMLGMQDAWVAAVYWLNIIVVILCAVYGALNWNKGADPSDKKDAEQ